MHQFIPAQALWYDQGMSTRVSGVRILEITCDCEGQRIDNVLARELKGVPRSLIYRIIRRGEVRINKGRAKPDYRVRVGDQVRIPPLRTTPREVFSGSPPSALLARLEGSVVHEDATLLVVNKPSGIPVHSGSGVNWGVIEIMRFLRPELRRLELVHRLDRETSGCLLLAKSAECLRELHDLFRQRGVDKRYLALVQGRWPAKRSVEAPLRRFGLRGGERMVEVSSEGKQARTWFDPVTPYRGATLVEALLETGRTHQIRVHAAHTGHPLAGDRKYGAAQFNSEMRRLGLRRLFLHAHLLSLPRPEGELIVRAELEAGLIELLNRLESR
jgi:23S rRNA pseudouridine955/2504/2580 synthase